LIHSCAALGVDPAILADHLVRDEVQSASIRQGLLLALGEYSADQRAELMRGPLVDRILAAYRDDLDPGIHSAAQWLLRRWQMSNRMAKIDPVVRHADSVLVHGRIVNPAWYVNSQGQTFAVIPAPGKFWIISPRDEKATFDNDKERHEVRIDYAFAVATK